MRDCSQLFSASEQKLSAEIRSPRYLEPILTLNTSLKAIMRKLFLPLFLIGAAESAHAALSQQIIAVAEPSTKALMIAGIITLTLLAVFLRKKLG
jgi:hypothetical protein